MVTIKEVQRNISLQDKFIEENQGLVWHIIRKKFPHVIGTLQVDDYFQCGCIGLFNAMQRFKEELGFKFATYAASMILGEIKRYRRDFESNLIKISRCTKDIYYSAARLYDKGMFDDEICVSLGIDHKTLDDARTTMQSVISMQETVYTDSNGRNITLGETPWDGVDTAYECVEKLALNEKRELLKNRLKLSECEVLEMHINGIPQIEIGKTLGVSQVHISRIIRGIKLKAVAIAHEYEIESAV